MSEAVDDEVSIKASVLTAFRSLSAVVVVAAVVVCSGDWYQRLETFMGGFVLLSLPKIS